MDVFIHFNMYFAWSAFPQVVQKQTLREVGKWMVIWWQILGWQQNCADYCIAGSFILGQVEACLCSDLVDESYWCDNVCRSLVC